MSLPSRLLAAAALGVFLLGCESAYYGTMERFGVHKRDILVDRVEEARDAQTEAKEQFQSALHEFSALTDFQGGDLEEIYDRLENEFERSEARAEAVHERIEAVAEVSQDLFDEWEDELDEYSSDRLRRRSAAQLRETRSRYERLMASMRSAEARIDPVLDAFRDQVLFLKHNLNARAIASLRNELSAIESDVAVLIAEMEEAIAASDRFIAEMRSTPAT